MLHKREVHGLLRDHNSIESSSLRTANPVLLQEKGGGV